MMSQRDAAEDVDQHGLDLGVGQDDPKASVTGSRGAAADVEEVGRLSRRAA